MKLSEVAKCTKPATTTTSPLNNATDANQIETDMIHERCYVKMAFIQAFTGLNRTVSQHRLARWTGTSKNTILDKDLWIANLPALLFIREANGDVSAIYYGHEELQTITIIVAKNSMDFEAHIHAARLEGILNKQGRNDYSSRADFTYEAMRIIVPYCFPKIQSRFRTLANDDTLNFIEILDLFWDLKKSELLDSVLSAMEIHIDERAKNESDQWFISSFFQVANEGLEKRGIQTTPLKTALCYAFLPFKDLIRTENGKNILDEGEYFTTAHDTISSSVH